MKDYAPPPQIELRAPEQVMRLERLGVSFPTRLSFLRSLIRSLRNAKAVPKRTHWRVDRDGVGIAVYSVCLDGLDLSLVAVSSRLDPALRSDRVIATAWDATFVLFDGIPDAQDLERISQNAPLQEAGRFCERDLVLSRANKSVRLWTHVVDALQAGRQPDVAMIDDVGYLMRTTAVYGNGKFGIADRHVFSHRPSLTGPFAVEMLTVWLIREFTLDLAEHVGQGKLEPKIRRGLGIGNATGLGMAPFLVTHPVLLNNWIMARETALARVRAISKIGPADRQRLTDLALRVQKHLAGWRVPDDQAANDIQTLAQDWQGLITHIQSASRPEQIFKQARGHSVALEELTAALLIEAFPEIVDELSDCMSDPFGPRRVPYVQTDDLRVAIEQNWTWALRDYDNGDEVERFWYVSAAKLEPRIGNRHTEMGADFESPLDIARRVANLYMDLPEENTRVCDFLSAFPEHLYAVQRIEIRAQYPYSDICDNLISKKCRPIDMLRAKLAFFGATHFDPKSDLWTRVTLLQGAPTAKEIATCDPDDWWLPEPLA